MTEEFEERADDVRVLLETAHVPPAHADLARAITSGTVVRRRRRYAAVAAATLFAVAGTAVAGQALDRTGRGERMDVPIGETVTSTPPPPPFSACTVSALRPPAGEGLVAGQVVADPTGRYAATSLIRLDGGTGAVLWTDGEPEVLATVGDNVEPRAVNAAGAVVGTATLGDGGPLAWLYRDGHVTRLAGVPGYEWWVPVSIDERGDVTGEAWRGIRSATVSWSSTTPGDRPHVSTKPSDRHGSGVGDAGTVMGTLGDGATLYVWGADGTSRALQLPPGAAAGQVLAARGDWAAGWVGLPSGTHPRDMPVAPRAQGAERDHRLYGAIDKITGGKLVTAPARWDLRTGAVTHWPNHAMPATAVNASGWVALPSERGPMVISPSGEVTALPGPADGYPTTLSDDNRRLYGERVSQSGGDTATAAPQARERLMKGELTELLMWNC